MRRRSVNFWAVVTIVFILSLASTAFAGKCPDEYQKVTEQKLSALAKDYEGCKVELETIFSESAMANRTWQTKGVAVYGKKYADYVVFRSETGQFVGLPKAKSDVIFSLKEGEKVKVKGKVVLGSWQGHSGMELLIDAESVEKISAVVTPTPTPQETK